MWFTEAPIRETAILDEALLSKINDLYAELSQDNHKPLLVLGGCEDAAGRLEELGLKRIKGRFKIDIYRGLSMPGQTIGHDWAEDREGTKVELIGKALNQCLRGEDFPDGVVLVKPGSVFDHRYVYPQHRPNVLQRAASLLNKR